MGRRCFYLWKSFIIIIRGIPFENAENAKVYIHTLYTKIFKLFHINPMKYV